MRMAVIERDGDLHYALMGMGRNNGRRWCLFCNWSSILGARYTDPTHSQPDRTLKVS